ncbi:hypothetical protein ACNKHS_15690 [Shigella flexneri]
MRPQTNGWLFSITGTSYGVGVGLRRHCAQTKRLEHALRRITVLQRESMKYTNLPVSDNLLELRHLVQVAELIVRCAMMREEGRGLRFTLD